jgi:hypothetical protein
MYPLHRILTFEHTSDDRLEEIISGKIFDLFSSSSSSSCCSLVSLFLLFTILFLSFPIPFSFSYVFPTSFPFLFLPFPPSLIPFLSPFPFPPLPSPSASELGYDSSLSAISYAKAICVLFETDGTDSNKEFKNMLISSEGISIK